MVPAPAAAAAGAVGDVYALKNPQLAITPTPLSFLRWRCRFQYVVLAYFLHAGQWPPPFGGVPGQPSLANSHEWHRCAVGRSTAGRGGASNAYRSCWCLRTWFSTSASPAALAWEQASTACAPATQKVPFQSIAAFLLTRPERMHCLGGRSCASAPLTLPAPTIGITCLRAADSLCTSFGTAMPLARGGQTAMYTASTGDHQAINRVASQGGAGRMKNTQTNAACNRAGFHHLPTRRLPVQAKSAALRTGARL